ncbi:UNVERIFIED_ORG: hypothetical protein ABIB19_002850 [Arthrobacter sp. UYEF10]
MVTAKTAAAAMPTTPTQYAPAIPANCITPAPRNGPRKMPILLTPPSVDSARARN